MSLEARSKYFGSGGGRAKPPPPWPGIPAPFVLYANHTVPGHFAYNLSTSIGQYGISVGIFVRRIHQSTVCPSVGIIKVRSLFADHKRSNHQQLILIDCETLPNKNLEIFYNSIFRVTEKGFAHQICSSHTFSIECIYVQTL